MEGQSWNILSIDDSRAIHAFLDRCFLGSSHRLVHAMGGKEGIEILRRNPAGVSIVLLDWEMPEMTGPETLLAIRNAGIQTPVVMLTSKNDPAEIEKMLLSGANEYIMKPFTPEILTQKIQAVLLTQG